MNDAVREIGRVRIAAVSDRVAIAIGKESYLLGAAQRDQFMRAWCEAVRQAEAWDADHAEAGNG